MLSRFGWQLKQNKEQKNKAEDLFYLIRNQHIHIGP